MSDETPAEHECDGMCWFCREGDPDGSNPPLREPKLPDPLDDIEGDER